MFTVPQIFYKVGVYMTGYWTEGKTCGHLPGIFASIRDGKIGWRSMLGPVIPAWNKPGKKRTVPFSLMKTQQILSVCIYGKTDAGTVLGSMRQSPEVPKSPVPHTVTYLIITWDQPTDHNAIHCKAAMSLSLSNWLIYHSQTSDDKQIKIHIHDNVNIHRTKIYF